ncbi:MAG TPA: ABC transporter substrate-binding protein [Flavobacteriales bacterium]|nr:ABC transporter substrate-binding protein [Flavobacteriales bacterium]
MKRLAYLVSALLLLNACGEDTPNGGGAGTHRVAKGGVVEYGGVFKVNEFEDFKSLYPLSIIDAPSARVAYQIYEGPLKFDPATLNAVPGLCESVTPNETATVFTLKLRKGAMFHDDECFKDGKGREVKAKDFKYCFDRLCSFSGTNQLYYLFQKRVKGAPEYFKSTENKKPLPGGVSGIKVVDDYTLTIELNYSFAGFTKILIHPACFIYPEEAVKKYGDDMRTKCVGTGPFKVKLIKEGYVILTRNDNYWMKDEWDNQLPYLNGVKITFIKEKKTELMEFRKRALDMVWKLPVDEIPNILTNFDQAKNGGNIDFELQSVNALSTQYYAFLCNSDMFKDKRVRQAFNYAIDRDKICEFVLQGEGEPAKFGFVPPFPGYSSYQNIKGYTYDVQKAKSLMAQAGFPNGRGFPEVTLQLNSGGSTNKVVAEAVQNMLRENLGIKVNMDILPLPEHLNRLEHGKSNFWRISWIADYPDPENFLSLFEGSGVPAEMDARAFPNSSRFVSAAYDTLLRKALVEIDETKRNDIYAQLDQMIIDEAVVMPIYYDYFIRLLQRNVRNMPINGMEYRDFTKVYFSNKTQKTKVDAANK